MVVGWPDYEVSSEGRVRSWKTRGRRSNCAAPYLIRQYVSASGYKRVTLYEPMRKRSFFVHRLVLRAFEGPCPAGHEAAHLDGRPENNSRDNLAWVTHTENMEHRARHGTIGRNRSNNRPKLSGELAREIRARHAAGESTVSLAKVYGVTRSAISYVVNNHTYREQSSP